MSSLVWERDCRFKRHIVTPLIYARVGVYQLSLSNRRYKCTLGIGLEVV